MLGGIRNVGLPMTANFGSASAPLSRHRDARSGNAARGIPRGTVASHPGVFHRLCCIGVLDILFWIVFLVLSMISFGLLAPLQWFRFGLIPLVYHTLLLSGPRSATWGMQCFDLELRSVTGDRLGFLQALAQTALLYVTVAATRSLILLFACSTGASAPRMMCSPAPCWCAPFRSKLACLVARFN